MPRSQSPWSEIRPEWLYNEKTDDIYFPPGNRDGAAIGPVDVARLRRHGYPLLERANPRNTPMREGDTSMILRLLQMLGAPLVKNR